jgi:hypothetical protein
VIAPTTGHQQQGKKNVKCVTTGWRVVMPQTPQNNREAGAKRNWALIISQFCFQHL